MTQEDCFFTVAVIKSTSQYFVHNEDTVGSQESNLKKKKKKIRKKEKWEERKNIFLNQVLASRNAQPQTQSPFLK